MAYTWFYARADEGPVALEVVALVGPAESGVSYGRYCRRCAALWAGSRRGDPKSLIIPFLFLGTLWWNCLIHTLYVMCVRHMNPSVGFHIGAAIAAFVVSSVAAFVCVWVFVTAVNLGVVAGV